MVTILPRFDPGGDIGRSLGSGIGQGVAQEFDRQRLRSGLGEVRGDMEKRRKAGEKINPLDVTLSLMDKFAGLPGGLQALSDLSPALYKEIARQNALTPEGEEGGSPDVTGSKKSPPGSVIEEEFGAEVGFGEKKPPTQIDPEEQYERDFQFGLKKFNDVDQARNYAVDKQQARVQEQGRRQQESASADSFLNQKLSETFPEGLSAPFKNEMSEQYFDLVKTRDPARAFNEIMPKFRAAQVAEESLKTASGSNRPLMFLGGESNRKDNARTALQPVSEIDPEYAVGLAQNELDWGPTEAASIVRPGSDNFKKFVTQIKEAPRESSYIRGAAAIPDTAKFEAATKKYVDDSSKKLEKFLREKFNPQTDSLQALRGDLTAKGFPDELYVSTVKKVFPGGSTDPKLSQFNQNEFPKLSERDIPGLQEIWNSIFSGNFDATLNKFLEGKFRGKR